MPYISCTSAVISLSRLSPAVIPRADWMRSNDTGASSTSSARRRGKMSKNARWQIVRVTRARLSFEFGGAKLCTVIIMAFLPDGLFSSALHFIHLSLTCWLQYTYVSMCVCMSTRLGVNIYLLYRSSYRRPCDDGSVYHPPTRLAKKHTIPLRRGKNSNKLLWNVLTVNETPYDITPPHTLYYYRGTQRNLFQ